MAFLSADLVHLGEGKPTGQIKIKNCGQTPANNVRVYGKLRVVPFVIEEARQFGQDVSSLVLRRLSHPHHQLKQPRLPIVLLRLRRLPSHCLLRHRPVAAVIECAKNVLHVSQRSIRFSKPRCPIFGL